MSYDIWFTVDTGGDELATVGESLNYTSNVVPMWDAAMRKWNLRDMHGHAGERVAPYLERGIEYMRNHPDEMRAMNPSNGWGNYEGALEFLEAVLAQCRAHPKAIMKIWR